jgi:hypothetical protein
LPGTDGTLARKIWSQPGNPGKAISGKLKIERWQLHEALHKIKQKAGLGPADDVTIWDDGSVTDANGDLCGVIHDEI